MSLQSELGDLQEGVSDLSEASEGITTVEALSEDVVSTVVDTTCLEAFNRQVELLALRELLIGRKQVDYGIACEVFTMLPDSDPLAVSKLTRYPSTINQDEVTKALREVTDRVPESVVEAVKQFVSGNNPMWANMGDTVPLLKAYQEALSDQLSRLEKTSPRVVCGGRSYDLLRDPLTTIADLDDTRMEYQKYENALCAKYHQLLSALSREDAAELTTWTGVEGRCLLDLVKNLWYSVGPTILRVESALQYRDWGYDFLSRADTAIPSQEASALNCLPDHIESLTLAKKRSAALKDDTSLQGQLLSLLTFID